MNRFDRYKETNKKDKRLGERTAKVIDQLSASPGESICQACRGHGNAKAAYRLLANDNFDDESILRIQRQQTIEQIEESNANTSL